VGCLLHQHGADLVAVIPLVAHQGRRTGKIPQQDINTREVAPLPLAEVKLYRTPLLVAHHMELAGVLRKVGPINPGSSHPLVEPGCRAMGFEVRGIKHQHLFRLGTVGSCQRREDQQESTVVRPAAETVVEGFVGSVNRWGIHSVQAIAAEDMDDATQYLAPSLRLNPRVRGQLRDWMMALSNGEDLKGFSGLSSLASDIGETVGDVDALDTQGQKPAAIEQSRNEKQPHSQKSAEMPAPLHQAASLGQTDASKELHNVDAQPDTKDEQEQNSSDWVASLCGIIIALGMVIIVFSIAIRHSERKSSDIDPITLPYLRPAENTPAGRHDPTPPSLAGLQPAGIPLFPG